MHKTDHLRSFRVEELTRVEGEGALDVVVDGTEIVDLKFKIFESPRFYEAFLRGRPHLDVTDITARICGICPVAYQTSSANAMEQALGIDVGDGIRDLRRLLYLGEWIESHALHIYLLHAPDFLGYPSGIALAKDFPDEVKRALRLKKIGNALMTLVGGREIHPINPRVGGFWRSITKHELEGMVEDLQWALDASLATVSLVAGFPFPSLEPEYEFVALHDPDEYAVIDGRIRSTEGIDIAVEEWSAVFEEEHVEWSNALHARIKGRGSYQVGPLARYNLNFDQLHPQAQTAATEAGLDTTELNPFKSIVVRAVELVHAAATCLDLIDSYVEPPAAYVEVPLRAGEGHGASEAPRGLLYHRYRIDEAGAITDAQIVPPTSQNQLRLEEDLRELLPTILELPDDQVQHTLEQAIRNYDPCISCATHFLDLNIKRL
jgi:coenzyme F420-reducing hydrogenase alpha subunit